MVKEVARLIPRVREVSGGEGWCRLDGAIFYDAAELAGSASFLRGFLEELLRRPVTVSRRWIPGQSGIRLRTAAPDGRGLRPFQRREYYELEFGKTEAVIAASGPAGFRNGVRTVLQLAKIDRGRISLPCLTVADWPDMEMRGVLWDMARQVERDDFLAELLGWMSGCKLNTLVLYLENKFAFQGAPGIAHPVHYTAGQVKRLVGQAERFGIQVIPAIPSLGHAEYILKHDRYAGLGEAGSRYQLCPSNPATYRLLEQLCAELAGLTNSSYFHINCDESPILGLCGRCAGKVRRCGKAGLLAGHINRLHEILARYGKRPMMWADMLLAYPESLEMIPKDVLLYDWKYGDFRGKERSGSTDFLIDKGFEVVVSPASAGIEHLFPRYHQLGQNITPFIKMGVKSGAKGAITNVWELFSLFPYAALPGLLCSAHFSWNASSDFKDFEGRMWKGFCGKDGGRVKRAMELVEKESLGGMGSSELEFLKRNPLVFFKGDVAESGQRVYRSAKAAAAAVFRARPDTSYGRRVKEEVEFASRFRMHIANRRLLINKALMPSFSPSRASRYLAELKKEIPPLAKAARRLWNRTRYRTDKNLDHWFLDPLDFEKRQLAEMLRFLRRVPGRSLPDFLARQQIIGITFYPWPNRRNIWETMQPCVFFSRDGKGWELFYNKHFGIWRGMDEYILYLATFGARPPRYVKIFFTFTSFPLGEIKERVRVSHLRLRPPGPVGLAPQTEYLPAAEYRPVSIKERTIVFQRPDKSNG